MYLISFLLALWHTFWVKAIQVNNLPPCPSEDWHDSCWWESEMLLREVLEKVQFIVFPTFWRMFIHPSFQAGMVYWRFLIFITMTAISPLLSASFSTDHNGYTGHNQKVSKNIYNLKSPGYNPDFSLPLTYRIQILAIRVCASFWGRWGFLHISQIKSGL